MYVFCLSFATPVGTGECGTCYCVWVLVIIIMSYHQAIFFHRSMHA